MIRRMVRMKLQDNVAKEDVLQKSYELLPKLPGVVSCRVGVPETPGDAGFDLILFIDFQRMEDVKSYLDNPIHQDYLDNFLEPRIVSRDVVNIRLW